MPVEELTGHRLQGEGRFSDSDALYTLDHHIGKQSLFVHRIEFRTAGDDGLAPESKLVQKNTCQAMMMHTYIGLCRHGVHASCSDLTYHKSPPPGSLPPLIPVLIHFSQQFPCFCLPLAVLESHFEIPGPTFSELQNHLLKVS